MRGLTKKQNPVCVYVCAHTCACACIVCVVELSRTASLSLDLEDFGKFCMTYLAICAYIDVSNELIKILL